MLPYQRMPTKSAPRKQRRDLCLQRHGDGQADAGNQPLQTVLHAEPRKPVAGMKDQRDHRGTDPIEDGGDRLEIAEIDVERAQCRDDEEVRQDESPAADPGTPEPAAQIGDVDPDLDRERPGQRLADGDRFAHLLLGQPSTLGDDFPFHLPHERDGAAEPEQAQAQEIQCKLAQVRPGQRHRCGRTRFWHRLVAPCMVEALVCGSRHRLQDPDCGRRAAVKVTNGSHHTDPLRRRSR